MLRCSPSLLRSLEDALKELGWLTPTLVLDEAQLYPPGTLEKMRLLLGLNLARQPTFALMLVGDLYLQDSLRLQQHEALYSRISVNLQDRCFFVSPTGHNSPMPRHAVFPFLARAIPRSHEHGPLKPNPQTRQPKKDRAIYP